MSLFIFYDLDGTLWPQGPRGGLAPESTVEVLNQLYKKGITQIISTGRPKAHVDISFRNSKINPALFKAMLYENGVYVTYEGKKIFNALEPGDEYKEHRLPPAYRDLRQFIVDKKTINHLNQKGFELILGGVIFQVGEEFLFTDYMEENPREITQPLDKQLIYHQKNDVIVSFKLPYIKGEVDNPKQLYKKRTQLTENLAQVLLNLAQKHNPNFEEFVKIVTYAVGFDHAIDLLPKFKGGYFVKDFAIGLLVEKLGITKQDTIIYCGDGPNDLSAMRFLKQKFGSNAIIVSPSNATEAIKQFVSSLKDSRSIVLQQDVGEFGVGLKHHLHNLDFID